MSNKAYDILKIIALIVMPALTTCTGTILETLDVSYAGVVVTIMTAISTCLGTILSKISASYYKKGGK